MSKNKEILSAPKNDDFCNGKAIIFFGCSGSGKSTAINSMLGCHLFAKEREQSMGELQVSATDPVVKISHTMSPGSTSLDRIAEKDGVDIWEYPGFKGYGITSELQANNSIKLMKLLKNYDQTKFVFVSKYDDFWGTRGQSFSVPFDCMASIFDNVELVKGSISMVITGSCNKHTPSKARDKIVEIAANHSDSRCIDYKTGRLLMSLKKESIALIPKIQSEGVITEDWGIWKHISKSNYCKVTNPQFLYSDNKKVLDIIKKKEHDEKEQEEANKSPLEKIKLTDAQKEFLNKVADMFFQMYESGSSFLTKTGEYIGAVFGAAASMTGLSNLMEYLSAADGLQSTEPESTTELLGGGSDVEGSTTE
ncbi:MAG: hypothetical protein DGJ47_000164 [Rickettsiaceae bacterium]